FATPDHWHPFLAVDFLRTVACDSRARPRSQTTSTYVGRPLTLLADFFLTNPRPRSFPQALRAPMRLSIDSYGWSGRKGCPSGARGIGGSRSVFSAIPEGSRR